MESLTIAKLTKYDAKELFNSSNVGVAKTVREMPFAEYGTSFEIRAQDDKVYVLKVETPDANRMSFGKEFLSTELKVRKIVAEKSDVKAPKILFEDFSLEKINYPYCITEPYEPTWNAVTPPTLGDSRRIMYQLGADLAKLHSIKGEGYGYEQLGLENNWASAFKKMLDNLVADATIIGVNVNAERIYEILDRVQPVLEEVECTLVHFDVCKASVSVNRRGTEYKGLTSWEQAFWGDFAADLISIKPNTPLDKNKYFLKGYRSVAPLEIDKRLEIRMDLMRLYLGLTLVVCPSLKSPKGSAIYTFRRIYGRRLFNRAMRSLEKKIIIH